MRRSHRQTTFLSQDDSELRMDGCCHCDSTQVEKKSKGEKRRCYDVQEEEEGDCEDPEPIQKNKRTISKPSREHPPARPHRRTPNHKIWGMITILKKRIEKYSTTSTHLRGNIQRLQDKLAKNEANRVHRRQRDWDHGVRCRSAVKARVVGGMGRATR